ncbi:MAG: transcription antitermination factor NusB [Myxococcota bacterium]
MDARDLAAATLVRVWTEDAFAAPVLTATLRRHPQLDERDARLATELVFGVLRTEAALERRIDRHASSPRYKGQPWVFAHLLIAAYCLAFLDRIPAHAAVETAVGAIKRREGPRVAGFANAVLRRLGEASGGDEPDTASARRAAAARQNLPRWLRRRLRETLGERGLDALLHVDARRTGPPPLDLCLAAGEDRDAWLSRLRDASRGRWSKGRWSPRCLRGWGVGPSDRLPGAGAAWRVQEQGAQVLADLVGATAGNLVLDACAGRGGKTWWLLEAVGARGAVDAADLHPRKLERLRERVDLPLRHAFGVDWTRGPGDVPADLYDVVLVDAPCTGVGTLARRPEIARRLRRGDPARLADVQVAIARTAATRLRPGGRLVYAVCSVLPEEGRDVALRLAREPDLEPASFPEGAARSLAASLRAAAAPPSHPGDQADGAAAIGLTLSPSAHDTDGYFITCFRRRLGAR